MPSLGEYFPCGISTWENDLGGVVDKGGELCCSCAKKTISLRMLDLLRRSVGCSGVVKVELLLLGLARTPSFDGFGGDGGFGAGGLMPTALLLTEEQELLRVFLEEGIEECLLVNTSISRNESLPVAIFTFPFDCRCLDFSWR